MRNLQLLGSPTIIANSLDLTEASVESYFKNYNINRFFPVRDLTPQEIALVKYYDELKYTSQNEIMTLCNKYNIDYTDYIQDRWILPKAIINMPDKEYELAMTYSKILLEPYVNYKNHRAPKLEFLTREEIAMLLSNIATGQTLIPGDQVTIRSSMEAMDRLLNMYDSIPKNSDSDMDEELKNLSPEELVELLTTIKKKKE
jgi:hypothetical protein